MDRGLGLGRLILLLRSEKGREKKKNRFYHGDEIGPRFERENREMIPALLQVLAHRVIRGRRAKSLLKKRKGRSSDPALQKKSRLLSRGRAGCFRVGSKWEERFVGKRKKRGGSLRLPKGLSLEARLEFE